MIYDNENLEEQWDSTVKGRQRLFVLHYCTNTETLFNATKAYEAAYPNADKSTCMSNSSKLLKKNEIKLAIKRLLKVAQVDIDEENVYKTLHDMALLATFNPASVITETGKLAADKLADLGENAKCISQIKMTKYGPEITLVDRSKYLQLIGTYLNLVRPETDIDRSIPVITLPDKSDDEVWNSKAEHFN